MLTERLKQISLFTTLCLMMAGAAQAELRKVNTYDEFISFVQGKTLKRPLVELTVTTDGRIEGRGMRWPVEGTWRWQDGYFCREIYWGGDPLGYNCQEVRALGDRIRFTSDKGSGRSAVFGLN